MRLKQRTRKQKMPEEFTRYLLEGIRKIREAATTTPPAKPEPKGETAK